MIIFEHTSDIIDEWLGVNGIGNSPHFEHQGSYLAMLRPQNKDFDGRKLTFDLLTQMETNWASAISPRNLPSEENWRFTKNKEFGSINPTNETLIEKAVSRLTDETWANQVPVASGLGDTGGRRCCIDLARRSGREFWLYELKWASNTPLSAAIQMLTYGVLYLFWRRNLGELIRNIEVQPVLQAATVHLRVLAPTRYYKVDGLGSLAWLETVISDGISHLARKHDIEMDFRFDTFHEPFYVPLYG